MAAPRHFLDIADLSREQLRGFLDRGRAFAEDRGLARAPLLEDRILAMIFERPSTRTRVSFQVAMEHLGGRALVLSGQDLQLGRGETIADTARVLSRYCDVLMLRTDDAGKMAELAANATVPVINGLTNLSHPCQVLADLRTVEQRLGTLEGRVVSWIGDGNNVLNSWLEAAALLPVKLRIAAPEGYRPDPARVETARALGASVEIVTSPEEAVRAAHVVMTDTWVSMGQSDETARREAFARYQVTPELMALADPRAIFLHCLPAHRGEEVVDAVIDGPQSAVWDQAENRLHVQKAVLDWCLAVRNL